jgi:uncharacterized lipoprotein YmbA
MKRFGKQALACAALAVMLAGCAGRNPPTRYYLLQPMAAEAAGEKGTWTLGVGPVVLARYLNRDAMVAGVGGGELRLAESDHWAEPLQDNVAQVLEENLANLLGAGQVLSYPWGHDRPVDWQAEVEIGLFHAEADGGVRLQARWRWYRQEKLLQAGRSDIRLPGQGGDMDYRALAMRQSEALAALSREMAAAVPASR